MTRLRLVAATFVLLALLQGASGQTPASIDWTKTNAEVMRHFQALIRIDTQDPPGNETKAVNYIKQVLEQEKLPLELHRQPDVHLPHHGNRRWPAEGRRRHRPAVTRV